MYPPWLEPRIPSHASKKKLIKIRFHNGDYLWIELEYLKEIFEYFFFNSPVSFRLVLDAWYHPLWWLEPIPWFPQTSWFQSYIFEQLLHKPKQQHHIQSKIKISFSESNQNTSVVLQPETEIWEREREERSSTYSCTTRMTSRSRSITNGGYDGVTHDAE